MYRFSQTSELHMIRKQRQPAYRLHKARNCAVVTIDGRNHYLGPYNSPESHEKYARLIAEWLTQLKPSTEVASPALNGQPLSTNELLLAYLKFAQTHYLSGGKPSKELVCMKHALRPVKELYGLTQAAQFGPKSLKAVRQRMIDQGLCRRVINARINRIRRVFKWAVSEELIPPSVFEGLRTVTGLQFGRTTARESQPVKPVDLEHVRATLPHVTPTVAAMIQVQMLTGMRACEVVLMRPRDLDRSTDVWLYSPMTHKTKHLGHEKIVPLGPQVQALLKPLLDRGDEEFLFSPRESEAWRRASQSKASNPNRKTKVYPSELRARARRRSERADRMPKRPKRERYDVDSYRRAITYGLEKARKANAEIPHWHPHQLRHTRATEVRRQFGLEGAQVALGHQSAEVSQIYAERDLQLAVRIAKEIG